jgi:AcrR family transcriptional regulator
MPGYERRSREAPDVRRRQVLDAALGLFLQDGYEQTTVAAIARRAGVATGTVYLYFHSKEHILLAFHQEFHARLRAAVLDVANELLATVQRGRTLDPREAVERLIGALGSTVMVNRAQCAVIVRYLPRLGGHEQDLAEDRDLITLVASLLEEGVRRGAAQVSDPEMAAELIAAGIRGPLGRIVTHGADTDVKRFLAQATELISKGLAPIEPGPHGRGAPGS